MASCSECGVQLTKDNWRPSQRKQHRNICKSCSRRKERERYASAWLSTDDRFCRECGVRLIDENWHVGDRKHHRNLCKSCSNRKNKRYRDPEKRKVYMWYYRRTHLEQERERSRNYYRNNIIHTNKGRVKVRKRPYPSKCELCGRQVEKGLAYHHWGDNNPSLGIWVCRGTCHRFCERVDKGLHEVYLKIKRELTATS